MNRISAVKVEFPNGSEEYFTGSVTGRISHDKTD